MTRRSKSAPKKKGGGGVLRGMRSGLQHMAGTEGGASPPKSKVKNLAWNIVTAILVLVTAAVLLRRFGVIHW